MASLGITHFRIFNLGLAVLSLLALTYLGSAAFRYYRAESPKEGDSAKAPPPEVPHSSTLQEYQVIVRNNPFDPASRGPNAVAVRQEPKSEPLVPIQRTDLVLLGTVVSDENPFAVIRSGGKTEIFHVDQDIPGAGKVEKISRKQVALRDASGKPLLLEIAASSFTQGAFSLEPPSADVFPPMDEMVPQGAETPVPEFTPLGDNRWRLSPQAAGKLPAELKQLLSQKISPQNKDKGNASKGFMVRRLRPTSLLRQLGLRPGDAVNEINGRQIDHPENAVQQLAGTKKISLGLVRRGKPVTLEFELE